MSVQHYTCECNVPRLLLFHCRLYVSLFHFLFSFRDWAIFKIDLLLILNGVSRIKKVLPLQTKMFHRTCATASLIIPPIITSHGHFLTMILFFSVFVILFSKLINRPAFIISPVYYRLTGPGQADNVK